MEQTESKAGPWSFRSRAELAKLLSDGEFVVSLNTLVLPKKLKGNYPKNEYDRNGPISIAYITGSKRPSIHLSQDHGNSVLIEEQKKLGDYLDGSKSSSA